MTPYVPLWCKSNFSFLEGASHPEELVETAHGLGLPALAVTDRDGVYGIVRAHVRAKELGLPLILGTQMTLDDDSTLLLLAQHREGYANLCRLITIGRRRAPKGECSVAWDEVCLHAPGLIALWGGARSRLAAEKKAGRGAGAPPRNTAGGARSRLAAQEETGSAAAAARAVKKNVAAIASLERIAADLHDAFGDRLYALLTRHQRAEEVEAEARLRARAGRYGLPLVAAVEVLYHTPERRGLQDVLTCIRRGTALHEAGRRRLQAVSSDRTSPTPNTPGRVLQREQYIPRQPSVESPTRLDFAAPLP